MSKRDVATDLRIKDKAKNGLGTESLRDDRTKTRAMEKKMNTPMKDPFYTGDGHMSLVTKVKKDGSMGSATAPHSPHKGKMASMAKKT